MSLDKQSEIQHFMVVDTTFIYALNDPETGECRYVGKTDNPTTRLSEHLKESRNSNGTSHRLSWLRSLTKRGLVPLFEILDEVPFGDWKFWERIWIKTSRNIGMDLTNGTDGGDGTSNPSAETRFKMGASLRGKKRSPESCAKQSATMLGHSTSQVTREKISAAQKGKKQRPEVVEKSRLARLGKKQSPEAIARRIGKKQVRASSKYIGVSQSSGRPGWWVAHIRVPKTRSLGRFKDEIAAAKAYDAAAKIQFGESAKLNFPNE